MFTQPFHDFATDNAFLSEGGALAVVVGDAGWRKPLRVWSRRPKAQVPSLRRYGTWRLGLAHRELVTDARIQWRQWKARRLWKVPPLLETRSGCARASTTSLSPGGGLTRNDEPAGRVPVTLSKQSFNLLWFTGFPATGWESGWHVSIKAPADPARALARSLRRGQASLCRATPFPARLGVFPWPSHTVHRHPMSSISITISLTCPEPGP